MFTLLADSPHGQQHHIAPRHLLVSPHGLEVVVDFRVLRVVAAQTLPLKAEIISNRTARTTSDEVEILRLTQSRGHVRLVPLQIPHDSVPTAVDHIPPGGVVTHHKTTGIQLLLPGVQHFHGVSGEDETHLTDTVDMFVVDVVEMLQSIVVRDLRET
uniref:Uncharacterized protein n=1 Tax=Timema poppense TaxID=170557 RepID=A0A7R9D9B2_TIMPO|nr:unnamed protein product [Timema poppensis]